ncbi:hypothetical protein OEZ85_006924 [Tetradesmus obliquus]|uniref:Rubisco LSMT substrate-binding domain-containing protein n=1 Tax=Tetradesmus obliquus TaxID=3088 RepID=A0ABY8TW13_TETOB|nr:hypothetical protein OEZ85_006924 [Tetradesmus obliquus]
MWQQLPWYAQLALVLLSELQQGMSSKFADYSALLPEQVDVPALWSEEELQQLRCPYFIEQSECELDVWSNAFRVVSTQQWRQGQQVFISYGQSSSDVLLQLYGFVEQGNVHERYLVRSLPDVLVKQELASAAAANSVELAEVSAVQWQGLTLCTTS